MLVGVRKNFPFKVSRGMLNVERRVEQQDVALSAFSGASSVFVSCFLSFFSSFVG